MLEKRLTGLYHVLSSDNMTKYNFGVAIAKSFGFNPDLIVPKSVLDSGLQVTRSPNLILKVEKLIHDLGEKPPTISTGIDRFYKLYQQGYPQYLRKLRFKTL